MREAGRIKRMETVRASTRNAAIRRSLVCPSVIHPPARAETWPGDCRTSARQVSSMKRLQQALFPLLALLAATGCGRVEGRMAKATDQVTITRSWPAEGIHQLRVYEING